MADAACFAGELILQCQWRIQDLEKEAGRPIFLPKGGGAHPILGLNWVLKMTSKLVTTGKKEGARPPAPPSKSATECCYYGPIYGQTSEQRAIVVSLLQHI